MPKFILIIALIFTGFSVYSSDIDTTKLNAIEDFLTSMNTLEAEMVMDVDYGNNQASDHYEGKIWLDRKNKLLRINYGKNTMVAKHGTLVVAQENESPQEFASDDTPAGILLRPSISFKSEGITVKSLTQIQDLWQLHLTYDSPAGSIPITLYFKPKPVMILMGWAIQNPNGSITNVHLNPEKTHMAIKIDSSVFNVG